MSVPIRTVGVVGAGTMGHGIAQVAALAGCQVRLTDVAAERAEAGLARIRENLDGAVARGKLGSDAAAAAVARIRTGAGLEAAAGDADLIIEAVPEDMALKKEALAALDLMASSHTLLASNTSSLSITELQMATSRPERVLGLHFFNPVHIMKLVEIVRGERTGTDTLERARAFVAALDKTGIVVRDSPGFATSRLGIALGNEAMRMLDEGVASAEDIDAAMELGYRHPMGPLRLSDLVGLDVRLAITEHLHRELGTDTYRAPAILRRLVRAGKLGKKTGEGFYKYES